MSDDEHHADHERLAVIGTELRAEVAALRDDIPAVRSELESRFRRLVAVGVAALMVMTALIIGLTMTALAGVRSTQALLVECTTPPPKPPPPLAIPDTREPHERHPCAEAARANSGAAERRIIDAGTADHDALRDAAVRIEESLRRIEAAHQ